MKTDPGRGEIGAEFWPTYLGNWLFCGFSAGGLPELLSVDDYARIRLAYRDGMSIREIARTFGQIAGSMLSKCQSPKLFLLDRPFRTGHE